MVKQVHNKWLVCELPARWLGCTTKKPSLLETRTLVYTLTLPRSKGHQWWFALDCTPHNIIPISLGFVFLVFSKKEKNEKNANNQNGRNVCSRYASVNLAVKVLQEFTPLLILYLLIKPLRS